MKIIQDIQHINNSTVRQTINLCFSQRELYNNGALVLEAINERTKGLEKFSIDLFHGEVVISYLRPKTIEEINEYEAYKIKTKALVQKEKIKHKNYIQTEAKKLGLLK